MKRFTKFSLGILGFSAVSLAVISTAYAASDDDWASSSDAMDSPALAVVQDVSDSTLNTMRGRFVDSNAVQYFGLEMTSYWNSPNSNLKASTEFSANLANPNNPQVAYDSQASVNVNGSSPNNNSEQTIASPNGLTSVNGIGQSIQIAGNGNTANNEINLNILGTNSSTPSNSSLNSILSNSGSVESTDPASGATAIAGDNGQQLMTELTIPGQGTVMQFLNHTGATMGSGIGQSIALTSNNNTIKNVLDLTVKLNNQTAIQNSSAKAALLLQKMGKL